MRPSTPALAVTKGFWPDETTGERRRRRNLIWNSARATTIEGGGGLHSLPPPLSLLSLDPETQFLFRSSLFLF